MSFAKKRLQAMLLATPLRPSDKYTTTAFNPPSARGPAPNLNFYFFCIVNLVTVFLRPSYIRLFETFFWFPHLLFFHCLPGFNSAACHNVFLVLSHQMRKNIIEQVIGFLKIWDYFSVALITKVCEATAIIRDLVKATCGHVPLYF